MTKKAATPKTRLSAEHRNEIIREVLKAASSKLMDQEAVSALVLKYITRLYEASFDTAEKRQAFQLLAKHGLVDSTKRVESDDLVQGHGSFASDVGGSLWARLCRTYYTTYMRDTAAFRCAVELPFYIPTGLVSSAFYSEEKGAPLKGYAKEFRPLCSNIMVTVDSLNAIIAVIKKASTVEALVDALPELKELAAKTLPTATNQLPVVVDAVQVRGFLSSIAPLPADEQGAAA